MQRNKTGLVVAGLIFCGFALVAQQATAPPGAAAQGGRGQDQQGGGRGGRGARRGGKKVVLAWADTRNGIAQHDSVSHALATIERLGYESGLWDTYIRTDSNIISKHPKMTTGQPASGGPNLMMADAIFFLGHREVELTADQKADLLAFVHDDGKGFVASHIATTAFLSWPEFGEMIGGQFDSHPWGNVMGTVINEDPTFPATKHLPLTFDIRDEFYQTKDFSREKSRVLLRLDTSKLPANQNVHITNGDFPIAWAKMYGKGRVFYATFAHDAKTWDDPDIYHLYFEAIKWALGLTDADVTPRPFPGPPAAAAAKK
jgi:type 1 glutamine amidotransferase